MIKRTATGNVVERPVEPIGPVETCRACRAAYRGEHRCPPQWIARDEWNEDVPANSAGGHKRFYGYDAGEAAEAVVEHLWGHGENGASRMTVQVQCVRRDGEWKYTGEWVRVTVDVDCQIELRARPLALASKKTRPRPRATAPLPSA